jgi:hypothetical protein
MRCFFGAAFVLVVPRGHDRRFAMTMLFAMGWELVELPWSRSI